jgi:hypothetical protein
MADAKAGAARAPPRWRCPRRVGWYGGRDARQEERQRRVDREELDELRQGALETS